MTLVRGSTSDSVSDLLAVLKNQGIAVSVTEDGNLAVRAARGKLSDALRDRIRENKPRLIEHLSTAREIPNTAPLTPAQKRLWLIDQLAGSSIAYHIPLVVRIENGYDHTRATAALNALAQRHQVLRTIFEDEPDGPRQRVLEDVQIRVEKMDPIMGEAAAQDVITRFIEEPFDLEREPGIRAAVVAVEDGATLFALCVHHIAADGWSLPILLREFQLLYAGRERELPQLPWQYGDYARWLRQQAKNQPAAAYWQHQLQDLPVTHSLPLSGRRAAAGASAKQLKRRVDGDRFRALQRLADDANVSLLTVVYSAFTVVLSRYGAAEDTVVGMPVANRQHPNTEGLIGFFVNTVVLRSQVFSDRSVAEHIRDCREVILDAMDYQSVPFEELVDTLNVPRVVGANPLFQIFIDFEAQGPSRQGQSSVQSVSQATRKAKFDLHLHVVSDADGMSLSWTYNEGLFDSRLMLTMFDCLEKLIERWPDEDTQSSRVGDLSIITDHDRDQIQKWNDTSRDFPELSHGLHEHIERQADTTPDAVALEFEGETLTYADLDVRANQIAHGLVRRGIEPEQLVGICMERCLDMVVSILGVLKAGAAWVPMDPDYPTARLRTMIEDSGACVLLISGDQPVIPEGFEDQCADVSQWVHYPNHRLRLETSPDQLAYVIYTSGSTGRPKGAMNEHRGVVNRLVWMQETYPLNASDVVLQKTPFSFDVSVWEFLWPLMVGARLLIARPGGHKDPQYLVEIMSTGRVTTCHFVPSMLRQFVDIADPSQCRALRRVFCSGEALSKSLVETFRASGTEAELHNLYGPTEAAIDVSYWDCAGHESVEQIPIGRPVANCTLHVLDANGHEQPIGCAGELHIGGIGVGRGYWRNAELTAEKFVPNPWRQGQHLYRTGDLARWLPDGVIEYLGRTDFQVKVRGFRIELGEIETALAACPGVRECLVTTTGKEDQCRLIAYALVADKERLDAGALRTQLQVALPEHMVPSQIQLLESWPLLPNGKIDRKALPAVSNEDAVIEPPATPLEEQLLQIWSALLGHDRLGVTQGFFEVGGHSLLLTRMAVQIRSQMDFPVTVADLYGLPTIRKMAEFIANGAHSADSVFDPPVRGEAAPDLPLSHTQRRIWFLQHVGQNAAYVMHRLDTIANIDLDLVLKAVLWLVERHTILRTIYPTTNGEPVQRLLPYMPECVSTTSVDSDEEARDICRSLAGLPFDLTKDAPIRISVVRVKGTTQGCILWSIHHIAADGRSMEILAREFSHVYSRLGRGEQPNLTPPAWQYADLSQSVSEEHIDDWIQALHDVPVTHQIPTDFPRGSGVDGRIALREGLATEDFDRLRSLARETDMTPFAVLHMLLGMYCARLSRSSSVIIGSPVEGRNDPRAADVVGFFANTLPIPVHLDGDLVVSDALRASADRYRHLLSMQEVSFDAIVNALRVPRMRAVPPLVQILLAYGESADTAPPTAIIDGDQAARLDIELSATARPDGLELLWLLDGSLFTHRTAQQIATGFSAFVNAAVRSPEQKVWRLPLLDEQSRRLLAAIVGVPEPVTESTLWAQFARQSKRTPDRCALVDQGNPLSYQQLHDRSLAVASAIAGSGHQAGRAIALYMDRTQDMVTALLGIFRARGICVPILPGTPAERIRHMVSDSGATHVITDREKGDRPAGLEPLIVVESTTAPPEDLSALPEPPDPDSLAYVLYTSGSTGRPKGVELPHRGLANHIAAKIQAMDLREDDDFLQSISYTFDPHIYEIFCPLALGARVILAPADAAGNMAVMQETIAQYGVRNAGFPPPLLAELMENVSREKLSTLRRLFTGGQSLTEDLKQQVLKSVDARFYNLYGPTECSIESTFATLRPGHGTPIGKPHAGSVAVVLDDHQQLLPPFAVGELYIGGCGLAKGYRNDAKKTGQSFFELNISDVYKGRMYRTGDLARWTKEGELEFHGRRDDRQVKINGLRIELGEIEAAIRSCPGITDACVSLVDARPPRLVAYVSGDSDRSESSELKKQLRDVLPKNMIPSAFVRLERFPVNAHGKVDRDRLPEIPVEVSEYVPPESHIEVTIAAIWKAALDHDEVSVEDDFFSLGGNSLLAVKVVSRINSALECELTVQDLFVAPTVRQLASGIETGGDRGCMTWVSDKRSDRAVILLPGAGLTGATYRPMAQAMGNTAVAFVSPPMKDRSVAGAAKRIVADWRKQGGFTRQQVSVVGHSAGGCLAFEVARLLEQEGVRCSLVMLDAVLLLRENEREGVTRAQAVEQLIRQSQLLSNLPSSGGGSISAVDTGNKNEDRFAVLVDLLVQSGVLDETSAASFVEGYIEDYIGHLRAYSEYSPSGQFGGPVSMVYSNTHWQDKALEDVVARLADYCAHTVRTFSVNAGHYSMLRQPSVASVAEWITASPSRSDTGHTAKEGAMA